MGKKIKKGTRGEAAAYVTRSQALKRLQLNLREFRRLCILKGIFPKDPKKKFKGVNKTYYYLKDIRFLSHEKLLQKFRDIQAYEKKIVKARMKKEKYDMNKLIENKPKYTLDHILKERYPRFQDAVSDMDDAMCLITLFANLPKHDLLNIKPETVQLCQRLRKEFYLYTAVTQSFRKAFISVKGIYLNVELMGSEVTWLHPFNHPQKLTYEVDYDIMLNFLELYSNLMKFVNLKLFKDIGMDYPPPLENLDYNFFGFNSFDIRKLQDSMSGKSKEAANIKNELNLDSEELSKIIAAEEENRKIKSLFKNLVFFISREIQSEIFGLAIMSAGGLYGDETDNSPFESNDARITHYVIDRPAEFITFEENKEYVQPQWIFDCINSKTLLPVSEYAPGKKLPPHLSPFYEYDEEGIAKLKLKAANRDLDELNEDEEKTKPDEANELKEMMISKNKKKLLAKIREEKQKKKRKLKTDEKK